MKTKNCPTLTGHFSDIVSYLITDFGWLLAPILDYLEPKRQGITHQQKLEMARPVKLVKISLNPVWAQYGSK